MYTQSRVWLCCVTADLCRKAFRYAALLVRVLRNSMNDKLWSLNATNSSKCPFTVQEHSFSRRSVSLACQDMEVEEAMEGTDPQQATVEYGELDLKYNGALLEAEQEPETSPHFAPAAYEEFPPPRLVAKAILISKVASRHLPWSKTKSAARDTYKPSRRVLPALTSSSPCHSSALFFPATIFQQQSQASGQCCRSSASNNSSVQPQLHTEHLCCDNPERISAHAGMFLPMIFPV